MPLFAKFLLVLVPVFVGLSGAGLAVQVRYDLRDDREALAVRVGNLSARVAATLARHGDPDNRLLLQDLLAPLASDQALVCAEVRLQGASEIVASVPAALGCRGQMGGHELILPVGETEDTTLVVRFSDLEIEQAQQLRRAFALTVVALSFLFAVIAAAMGFQLIVQRPLRRLWAAIRHAAETGERRQVATAGKDELGRVIRAFNDMQEREALREQGLADANRALQESRLQLEQVNEDLEARVRARTADLDAARRRAEDANSAKSRFLATISHELRTPLNGVIGMCELLRRTRLDDIQQRYLDTVGQSGRVLLSMVNDVLDLSKIEAGKFELDDEAFDPAKLIGEIVTMFGVEARRKGLALEGDIEGEVPSSVRGDPARLRQVLVNLVGNALKFTERGAIRVRLSLAAPPGVGLRFAVEDGGIGIPEDKQALIFDAFEQVDNSATRRQGGTGLGLAICKQLVELMGGRIGVESRVGSGSTFWVTLPLAPAEAEQGTASDAVTGARSPVKACSGRVLLVEDNPVNSEIAHAFLDDLGCEVVVAENGLEAVERFQDGAYGLVFMDCSMPQLDGYEATRRIREIERQAGASRSPIIALTAHVMAEDVARCAAAGMDGHLTKPFTNQQLAAVLEQWLAGPSLRAPAERGIGRRRVG